MTYQSFLVQMMTTSDAKLVKADVSKLAEKYGVKLEWAEGAVRIWLRRSR
jgi:hypothetical protein